MKNEVINIIWPLAFGLGLILLWEFGFVHQVLDLKPFQLPVPTEIASTLWNNLPKAMKDCGVTISGALIGMLIGSFMGFVIASIATFYPKWGYGGLIVIAALNAVPIVALSPIMNLWFSTGMFQKIGVVAEAKGYYEEEGIDIVILPGGSDIIPEQQVYNGVADIGVTWVSTLMKYQSQGWELQHVGQIFQKSAMLLVSKAATGINSPTDLEGKKVGSWFGGNEYEIFALLEANGLDREKDLQLVQQDYTMNQIMNDTIDAASAMTYNEYGLLLEAGLKDSELNVIDMMMPVLPCWKIACS